MAMQSGDEREILRETARLLEAGEPFVLATVVATRGSTPRNAGARMIWRPASEGNATPNGTLGTVGGGQFEHLVLDAARTCFANRTRGVEHFVLGSDADQCCGGTMEVFLEYHGAPARVVVFGAGHVSHALAGLLAGSSLALVIVDDRAEWNSETRFSRARRVQSWREGVRLARSEPEATLALVMTCSHETDFELLRGLLATASGVERAPAFVGLIGSRSKRACLFSRLVASGIDETEVARVHCPIGVGDTGKEPRAVAISVAAQLLMEAQKLGGSVEQGRCAEQPARL